MPWGPIVVLPIRENFWSLKGRRVRMLDLSDSQRRVIFSWGTDFRAALKVYRSADPQLVGQIRDGDSAVFARGDKRPRRKRPFFYVLAFAAACKKLPR